MEILKKLGFKNLDDFKNQLEQETEGALEIKELLSELAFEELKNKSLTIKTKNQLIDYLRVNIGRCNHENFKVIFLDGNNRILGEKTLFEGTINKSAIYLRRVVEEAFKYPTTSIIFCHNHPSGEVKPSQKDIELTQKAKEILKYLDINLLEHIIISKNDYYSFLENNDI